MAINSMSEKLNVYSKIWMIFYHSHIHIEVTFHHLFWSYLKIWKPVIITCAFGKVESNFESGIRKHQNL